MKKLFTLFLVLIASSIIISCAAKLTSSGSMVKYVTKQEAPNNCKEIGEVDFGAFESGVSVSDVKVQMRNKTAKMGGNYLVIDAIEKHAKDSRRWYTGSGRAYNCSN